MKKCVLCKQPIVGYGSNPAPLKSKGECCRDCDRRHVIPLRLALAGIYFSPEQVEEMIMLEDQLIQQLYKQAV